MHKTAWAVAAALGLTFGGGALPARAQIVDGGTPPVDATPPVLGVTRSSPVVSPNGDGRLDRVTIRVTVDEDVTLTVRLHNPTGIGERFLATDQPIVAGTAVYVWNGRLRRPDGTWRRARDGAVTVDVEAHDGLGNRATATLTLVVDTTAPSVHLAGVSPEPWTGGGILTEAFRARDVSPPLTIWGVVLQGDRRVDEMDHRVRPAGTTALHWHPEAHRRALTPGAYQAQVVVRDAAGNTGRSTVRPFRVHRSGPTHVINQVEGAGHRIGLTIDDCVHPDAWRSMLGTLERMDAGATFFCNGNNVRRYPDLARRTVATDGVSVGSHSTDHADLTTVGYSGAFYRLWGDEAAWWDVARTTPAPWFRPPYGAYNSTVLAAAGAASFPYTVLWDIDPRDWDTTSSGTIVSRSLSAAKGGSILLLHVQGPTAAALPSIIAGLRARGLDPVGMPELVG